MKIYGREDEERRHIKDEDEAERVEMDLRQIIN